jgi:hypothetical protein
MCWKWRATGTLTCLTASMTALPAKRKATSNPAPPSASCAASAIVPWPWSCVSNSCLVSWRFNPSVGLMLKFTGDVVTLVLIRGSNLDALVNDSVDLPHGIQRHRIMWVREMDKAETRQVGQAGPTIDKIEVAEFESQEEMREWLTKAAPSFLR